MATNEVYRHGTHIPLEVPTGTKSGDPVAAGEAHTLPGVAVTDRLTGETKATVWLEGAWRLTVDGAVTETGTPVYINDDGTRQTQLTTTATDNLLFGYALEQKTATAAPIDVLIARA